MNNLSNINIKGLSKKLKIKGGLAMLGLATIMSVTACSPKTVNNTETTIIQTRDNDPFNKWLDDEETTTEMTTEETTTEGATVEDDDLALNVERFSKLVDEIMEGNKEVDFNVRRESIETLFYVCNMSMATPELSKLIEGRFTSKEEMMNSILETITSYDMNMVEAWYGNDSKHADLSKLFLNVIDKDAISYVQTSYDILANNINDNNITEASRNESIEKFMDEIIDYSKGESKIENHTSAELTSGASLVMNLLTTDGNSYLATTGLVNNYQDEINNMSVSNMESILGNLYSDLSKPIKRTANRKPMLLEKVGLEVLNINEINEKSILEIDSNTTTEEMSNDSTIEETKITKLDEKTFEALVDETMEENKELDFNVRRESIEALLYVCNMSIATPELSKLIEGRFISEERMINSILETITSYDMNMVEAWYNNTKHADLSKLFLDEIDRDTISYVQTGYDILANNINDNNITEASRNESIVKFMDEIINYSLYNGKINGYTNAELTSGASLVMSLLTTDGNSYLATTGLVNNYQNEIDIMSTKDMEIILSQLYGELNVAFNLKSSLENCFERPSYTK